MAAELKLELLGEKALHQAANPRLLAYCPSMDLLALGSTDQQVLIYRLNGQRVSVATQGRSSPSVEKIGWKPNGTFRSNFNQQIIDILKANYLPLHGGMGMCVWSGQRAVRLCTRSLLMHQLSRASAGHRTAQAKILGQAYGTTL
jgi:anaphase-promoting complex subunit 4